MSQQHGRREAPEPEKTRRREAPAPEKTRRSEASTPEKPRRRHHPIRNIIIVLVILALLAAAAYYFLLPIAAHRLIMPLNDQSAVSASVESTEASPASSAVVSEEPAASEETTSEPAQSAEPAVEEETESAAEETEEATDPLLVLVNKDNPLPDGYADFLVLTDLSNGTSVAEVMYPDLQEMFDAMRAEGVYPVVASGYRTAEEQQALMDEKVASFVEQGYTQEDAEAEALLWVNPVGYSEHQTGLAVDINADGVNSEGSDVYNWLAEHAWEYGFILRYPEGKTDITGTDYEAWHYRYVGRDNAKLIYDSGLTLEEYLAQ